LAGERLQKVMARAGIAARRKCEEIIRAGRVTVNGKVVTELGTRVDPEEDIVAVDGKLIANRVEEYLYYALYKPVGYLTAVSDERGRPTARSLVPSEERLYPVGRLDLRSEGLLLFTNDGEMTFRLLHPRYGHEKEYLVLVQGVPPAEAVTRLRQGVHLDDGITFVRPEVVTMSEGWGWRREPPPEGCHWLRVTLREGRKREIRRMLEVVGFPVERLVRVRMSDLLLGELKPGQGRWLSKDEVHALRRLTGLEKPLPVKKKLQRRKPRVEENHRRVGRPGRVGQEHRGSRPRR
jgi:pseudouridine synthase